jgi:hypothetical protein
METRTNAADQAVAWLGCVSVHWWPVVSTCTHDGWMHIGHSMFFLQFTVFIMGWVYL